MKYYSVAEIDITDQSWVPDYVANVTKIVESHGGRYLARTPKVEQIEGARTPPQIYVIVEWPSREAAREFYDSEAYAPFRQRRIDGARNEFFLVAGEDIARQAAM